MHNVVHSLLNLFKTIDGVEKGRKKLMAFISTKKSKKKERNIDNQWLSIRIGLLRRIKSIAAEFITNFKWSSSGRLHRQRGSLIMFSTLKYNGLLINYSFMATFNARAAYWRNANHGREIKTLSLMVASFVFVNDISSGSFMTKLLLH